MSTITDAYQVGQEVRIIPDAMDCPQEWMEESRRPYWIARVDAIDGGKLDYTISSTWPPSRPGFKGCELTDDFGHHMLRDVVGDNFAQSAKNSPAVSRAAVLEEAARVADEHHDESDCAYGNGWNAASHSIAASIRALSTVPASEPAAGWTVERLAQWLHDEGGFDDAWPNHTWPEHPDDTGQRDSGWVKIVPSDVQAKFREVASRLAGVTIIPTPPGKMGEEARP